MERLCDMIRIFCVSAIALLALLFSPGDRGVKSVFAHGLVPADHDLFYRRFRGEDEVTDEDRGGGRGRDKNKGRDKDNKGSDSSGGGKGGDSGGRKSGSSKNKTSGRPNANDSYDRFGN